MKKDSLGREWLALLPPHIQKQVLDQIDNEEILDNQYDDMNSFINNCFEWSNTDQGHSYWKNISYMNPGTATYERDLEILYGSYPEYSNRDGVVNNYTIY